MKGRRRDVWRVQHPQHGSVEVEAEDKLRACQLAAEIWDVDGHRSPKTATTCGCRRAAL